MSKAFLRPRLFLDNLLEINTLLMIRVHCSFSNTWSFWEIRYQILLFHYISFTANRSSSIICCLTRASGAFYRLQQIQADRLIHQTMPSKYLCTFIKIPICLNLQPLQYHQVVFISSNLLALS